MNTRLKVSETMDLEPATAPNDPSVQEAARTMRDRDVGCLLLMDGPRVRGLMTERDILKKVVAEGLDAANTPCSAVMSTKLVTSAPEHDIQHALRTMRQHRIRHLPVLDEGRLVGLVTERGISQVAPELLQIVEEWHQIAHPEDNPGSVLALDSIRIEGACEACGNDDRNLHEHDGSLLCEDCLDVADRDAEAPDLAA